MSDQNMGAAVILVVDDEEVVLDLFSEILSLDGHRIYTARNAEEALGLIRQTDFDVVISDFRMPKASGEELFHQAIAFKPQLEKRFVFTSGEMDPETKQQFINETGVNVIAKPFQIHEVRALIKSIVESGKTR